MILIGQYDSPFVRRVGIALKLYDMKFEHRPWSVFADADKIRRFNPLIRVPTLVLDDGTSLLESGSILDYLDHMVGSEPALYPVAGPARFKAMRIASLACGFADKAVSLFYEKRLHTQVSDSWVNRCRVQISSVLEALETERKEIATTYWFGSSLSHADIAVTCAWRFLNEAHPGLVDMQEFPALTALTSALEKQPAFEEISQAFIAPT